MGAKKHTCHALYLMLALALLGLVDAGYVAQGTYFDQVLWCPIVEGCNTVAQSPYARLFGIPLSYLGVLYYAGLLVIAALLARAPTSRTMRLGALLATGIGVAYSAYAVYLQVSAIHALCIYCMISAVLTLLLFALAGRHFRMTVPSDAGS